MAAAAPAPRTLWLLLLLLQSPPGDPYSAWKRRLTRMSLDLTFVAHRKHRHFWVTCCKAQPRTKFWIAHARGEVCTAALGDNSFPKLCPDFCCGSCSNQYCCSDVLKRIVWTEDACAVPEASVPTSTEPWEQLGSALRFRSSFDDDPMSGFGATVAIGLTIFVLSVVTIIICFTCSCCCLYKMCRRPRPIVTTTTATTVVHAPYPQPPSAPPSYPGPTYQGYHPMPPQPGMPAAPYPMQYPPPYPAQPMGPPAYHETLTGGAAASQPPYNPAYMDPPKAAP